MQSIRNKAHNIHRNVNDALEGDQILIECRKPSKKWSKKRSSEKHYYYFAVARKNAYAVLKKTYTNLQK